MGSKIMRSWLWLYICVVTLAVGSDARAQATDPRCTKICVVVLQAVGDDIKEQIYLECNQTDGSCEGSGHILVANERLPVLLTSTLDGNRMNLWVKGSTESFATEEADHIVMDIDSALPRQARQFVVRPVPLAGGSRRSDSPLFLTVVVEQLLAASN